MVICKCISAVWSEKRFLIKLTNHQWIQSVCGWCTEASLRQWGSTACTALRKMFLSFAYRPSIRNDGYLNHPNPCFPGRPPCHHPTSPFPPLSGYPSALRCGCFWSPVNERNRVYHPNCCWMISHTLINTWNIWARNVISHLIRL